MTIKDIIVNGKGSAGSNGAWKVEPLYSHPEITGHQVYSLWHYSTRMAVWRKTGNRIDYLSLSIGNGSVSDQGGMNTFFRMTGAPHYYYSRKGGARIVNQETNETVTSY